MTIELAADTIEESVQLNVQNARKYFHVWYVMMKLRIKIRGNLRRIISLIDILLRKLFVIIVKRYSQLKRIVKIVGFSLLNIIVIFVIFLMMMDPD